MTRLVHISDLHIGKKLKECSLDEDQRHILRMILDIVRDTRPDGVLIAGDVYDTSNPSAESVSMLDWFLTELTSTGASVFMISGNHDSPERLGFGSEMFRRNNLYIAGVFDGAMEVHTIGDGEDSVDICMLPFVKPVHVRRLHPEDDIQDTSGAVRSAISHTEFGTGGHRVAVAHQFVTAGPEGPITCDSESVFVGGAESVDVSVFDGFDYVALGHLHRPQSVGRDTVRYCGTPLKYSLSEADDEKSVTVVDIGDNVTITTVPLVPLREMRVLRGPLDAILSAGKTDPVHQDDFVYVELDSDELDAMARLREVFPHVMSLTVRKSGSTDDETTEVPEDPWDSDPVELFDTFFRMKMNRSMTPKQRGIIEDLCGRGCGQ